MAAANPIMQELMDMPPITRMYTTACFATTAAVQLDMVSPFHLYFNPSLIFYQWEVGENPFDFYNPAIVWRLVTSFCFFGSFGFSFLFNMIFTYRYCRMLEESQQFRHSPGDFLFMFIFGGVFMTVMALFVHMLFLGHALTIMMVYVWSRRNPHIRMNFFGLISFNAPYLPWVLLAFSVLLGNSAIVDFMGIACGHFYYFLQDVFPNMEHGMKVLYTPAIIQWLFRPANEAVDYNADDYVPLADDQRPGGLNFNEPNDR